jgi:hypothetical protein
MSVGADLLFTWFAERDQLMIAASRAAVTACTQRRDVPAANYSQLVEPGGTCTRERRTVRRNGACRDRGQQSRSENRNNGTEAHAQMYAVASKSPHYRFPSRSRPLRIRAYDLEDPCTEKSLAHLVLSVDKFPNSTARSRGSGGCQRGCHDSADFTFRVLRVGSRGISRSGNCV